MSLLQPLILAALPLAALPIIIHLINQRRFQTVNWGAMMFLLAANRMARGYARIRQWLILALRVLALMGLIFALSRPLASGWLGLTAGSRIDTTIVLLDRSSSMSQQEPGASRSKLRAAVEQLSSTFRLLRSNRWILIDSQTRTPHELEKPDDLLRVPEADPTSATADIPAMLDAARQYIRENKTGRTEIWIASDLRKNDWDEQGGRWDGLRSSFLEFPQAIRFHLLAYADRAADNLAVRVTGTRRQRTPTGSELLLSLIITRDQAVETTTSVPLRIEIEGASSELNVEFAGDRYELRDHPVPLDSTQERGWGRVSLPTDGNPADNEAYFVFAPSPPRQTILVTDQTAATAALQAAADIAPDPSLTAGVEVLGADQLASVDWPTVALVLWQSALPGADTSAALKAFVERGGQLIFFPPETPGSAEFAGVRWTDWQESVAELGVESWRGDQDILSNTKDGSALPVGELRVRRFCGLSGELLPLATLKGGQPLLSRLPTDRGGIYFVSTTTLSRDSSFTANGIVLYVMIQRALTTGASVLGDTRDVAAGETAGLGDVTTWTRVAGPDESISTDYAYQRGIYADGSLLVAVNRPPKEDEPRVVEDADLKSLFTGLDFSRVDDRASSFTTLVQEIWRSFLLVMMIALVGEAALCIPKIAPKPAGATS